MVKLGTLYFNGEPQKLGTIYLNERITIGAAIPGKEISWVKRRNGSLVADQNLCFNISWDNLDDQDLAYGKVFHVDGKPFLCRLPKLGAKDDDLGEWGAILDEVGDDQDFLHWAKKYSWGQTAPKYVPNCRTVFGFHETCRWRYIESNRKSYSVGFRPILDPLSAIPEDCSSLIGTSVTVMDAEANYITGELRSFSDYDLIVEPTEPPLGDCSWAVQDKKKVIIDRAGVCWLKA